MSTFFNDIRSALANRLNTLATAESYAISWENTKFNPDAEDTYIKQDMLFGETVQACVGDDGKDLTNGIYQLSVYRPLGGGLTVIPDKIADHFKRGTVLTKNTVSVRIVSASISVGFSDENFYIIPVSIRWQAFTDARAA